MSANLTPIPDELWLEALQSCGDTLRKGAPTKEETLRDKVLARSYTFNAALNILNIRKSSFEVAVKNGLFTPFTDPEKQIRVPAQQVESAVVNADIMEQIHAHERIFLDDLAVIYLTDIGDIRKRLKAAGITSPKPEWHEVRGLWGLPQSLREFRLLVQKSKDEKRKLLRQKNTDRKHRQREARRLEELRLNQLREQLVQAFPSWRHEGRESQVIYLHVGPPNSGKTHDALLALEQAGTGWYLAPLRLLAFEIFDRLNARGTPCNLLTGEEYIPVEGARITAATIEMFNPQRSGDCVIIDEAQMLADADRGWAWTRALMETQSPEIHVIAPTYAQSLIESLAEEAGIELELVEHDRLTPIRIADQAWSLADLPPKTILVAFSRQNVLDLKAVLEEFGRNVSIVYGSLPPEVRRKQSDRFANGETDVCVATDAVGMGLNLPADFVCFYDVEKFDGREVRLLTPPEVQQIGGRAGRYGFAQWGEVGALNKYNLRIIRKLFYTPPIELQYARVAPQVEDLALIPGTLSEQLIQWSQLQSIPDSLRYLIRTADMSERIELAKMLSNAEVRYLGLETSMRLVNAPTNKHSRNYWRDCATSIISQFRMPLPQFPPLTIENSDDLEATEQAIACADIYLWLGRREEFAHYAPEQNTVRALRNQWSIRIDDALVQKMKMQRHCRDCGRPLPPHHRFRICDRCFNAPD